MQWQMFIRADERAEGLKIVGDNEEHLYVLGKFATKLLTPDSLVSSLGNYFIAKIEDKQVEASTKDLLREDKINFYPNPTSGIFTIQSDVLTKEAKVFIYDVLGNCILIQKISSSHQQIDFSDIAKGIYFIKFLNGEMLQTEKIVIR